jgi:hypothetical protein
MKKIISATLALCIALSVSACTVTVPEETAATTPANTAAATTAAATAVPQNETGEVGEIFAELLYQYSDEFETIEYIELCSDNEFYTPAMTELNEAIYNSVGERINSFDVKREEEGEDFFNGLDVRAYSISDENVIQIYYTVLEYPTYGTAGDLYGFVYDIAEDDYITLEEFTEAAGTDFEILTEEIVGIYSAENPDDTIGGVYIKTFNLAQGPDGEYVYGYLLEMEVTPPEGDVPWKGFYMYTPYDGLLFEMNEEQLFDPYSVDEYDPPIRSNPGWSESDFTADEISMGEEFNEMDYLWDVLGDLTENRMMVGTGEEEINGVTCKTYTLGTSHEENYVAEYHFAVAPDGTIYTMDVLQGPDWIPYE